jgi:prophage regulatory protein
MQTRTTPLLAFGDTVVAVSRQTDEMNMPRIVEDTQTKSGGGKEALYGPDEVIFLRLPKVKAVTGLSKSSLYELIRSNSFPAPVRLGARTVAWVASEVNQWAAERILRSRAATPNVTSKQMPKRALPGQWASSKKWA